MNVEAWRFAQVTDDGVIKSPIAHPRWQGTEMQPDGVQRFQCVHGHEHPDPDCRCGIYWDRSLPKALWRLRSRTERELNYVICRGLVNGIVRATTDRPLSGNRAAAFQLTHVYAYGSTCTVLARRAADRYGVEIGTRIHAQDALDHLADRTPMEAP